MARARCRRADAPIRIKAAPPPATARGRVGAKLDLGVRAMNAFTTCCQGQRMGIFAGSGVGKSTLLAMLARNSNADAIVIGLIGERGREVKEFIEDDLGAEGLARSVVVAATSDEAPLVRRQAAYVAMTVAEQLRDQRPECAAADGFGDPLRHGPARDRPVGRRTACLQGLHAHRLRRTAAAAGTRRARRRTGQGSITGLFTVLVEGDDHNEPVSDAVRGILDGHIVLDRAIAERGRFPAINVLKSVSRAMPGCNSESEQKPGFARPRAPDHLRRHGRTDPAGRLQGWHES